MATQTKERKQAHGLTSAQMRDLKESQIAEENVPSVRVKNGKGTYIFPKHEKHLVHAKITAGGFSQQTGLPLATPMIQKFDVKEFQKMEKELAFAGMKVEILHDGGEDVEDVEPTDHLKAQVVSQPGAGTPLTETFADYEKLSEKRLKDVYSEFFPGKKDQVAGMKKAEMLNDLREHMTFLAADDTEAATLGRQEAARIHAATFINGGNPNPNQ